ncbi:hypothetical protein [Paraflavitalea speifideaquila]|uniref:hypothetical protein n=1 Tax=Paraflavitalea speifideaquila TaxID=3076558 RepID=UPI0028E8EFE7|nr:hypothetical protein [Paraflavitalea speifideiaquila]
MRTNGLNNAKFEGLDINKDSVLSSDDFKRMTAMRYQFLLNAIDKGNDDWIWNNYFRVTSGWLKEHFTLEPNKTRLLRVNTPSIFSRGMKMPVRRQQVLMP